jgi:shikimate dehydrogenase
VYAILLVFMRTMYFIGVATGLSAIHAIFPRWTKLAGIGDARLKGVDLPLGSPPEAYCEAVRQVRDDPGSWGALVTSHKTALYESARDLFSCFDDDAQALGEVSCIVRRDGLLSGMATGTLTVGLALRDMLAGEPFHGEALIMGAGGAGVALAVHLRRCHEPARVILTDVSPGRIVVASEIAPAECMLVDVPEDHDRIIGELPPGALIVNATGMGKDRPGCPVTLSARIPAGSIAWDFNYHGDLNFLSIARALGARAMDGWDYFLHGWSQIMSRVFDFDLTPELFDAMRREAERGRA